MLLCNQYVTVWNRWRGMMETQSVEIFYRHILPVRCKYKKKVTRAAVEDGVIVTCSQQVTIPVSNAYRSPSEWAMLDDAERKEFFTLQEGDMMSLGAILFDITGITPWREADVRKRLRPEVLTIRVIHDCTRDALIKHWKVEGS